MVRGRVGGWGTCVAGQAGEFDHVDLVGVSASRRDTG